MSRKQKIKELVENFRALRRSMAFHTPGALNIPRITPSQWGVLIYIERRGKSTVKEVAKNLHITSSASTQLIDGLVESGYVVRETHDKDRRAVTLTLSKKTKAQVYRMNKERQKKFLKFFEILTEKELDQYIMLNKKIVERAVKK
ncbi:MAG TPA: MarR family transcriptional regulator [Candidatus Paceibacterota bacterium]|jgi:DNA-binding MarR family transcriptional regulator|nr:MarR family transcriptional regulator [Candidatus Paceibacterota bacterium]